MPHENVYRPARGRHVIGPDGKVRSTIFPWAPAWILGHWRHLYGRYRGKERRKLVVECAAAYRLDVPTAEKLLKGELPTRTEDDGTLYIELPD
jgi:hypothetical protein